MNTIADASVHHVMTDQYEPSWFRTYSKKIGMWLFLLSDSLTFGALLFAYSYGRLSNPAWPTPFHKESILNASIMTAFLLTSSLTMVLAVMASSRNDRTWTRNWLLATMAFGTGFVLLHGAEWSKLISEGMRIPIFPPPSGKAELNPEFVQAMKNVPQFAGTFFTLTGMHMLHVSIGIIYLGAVALKKLWLPILGALWLAAWLLTPDTSPFHYGAHVLLAGLIVCAIVLFLKPKDYSDHDIEVSGLYWHFVDLVWMFIFPMVYLMSTKITG
jgi:cytochrome c oxidase subunit III